MNAQVTIETINPKTAAEWLENKWEEQRHIRENQVRKLSSEITRGTFRLTSDALLLIKGRLANGQHRLSALVLAGKSAQFIVMRSNDEELYKVLDCGAGRTVRDVIGHGVKYNTCVASSARLAMSYDRKLVSPTSDNLNNSPNSVLTRSELLEYIEKHQSVLEEQAGFVSLLYCQTRIVGSTVATAFLHIASRKKEAEAKKFLTNVYCGTEVDAAKTFRDRMIKQMGTKSRLRQEYIFALLVKAWKSYINGTLPGKLGMNEGEQFPQI